MHLNRIILTILLTFFLGVVADSSEERVRKIAIIGGGVGGTSCAYFLNELLGPDNINVDVYEAHKIGGRLATVEINGNNFEAGGSIIHPRNQYMKQFVDTLGLKVKKGAFEGKVGLYDGNQFVFVESEWQVVTYFRMFWRYGMDLFRMENYIQKLLGKFENIYSIQSKKRKSFETVRKLLSAMSDDLPEYLTMSVEQAFRSKKDWNSKLIEELVLASIRVNYGQNNLIHQFVGSVSVAGAMDGLWSVEGGNCQVPEKLLEYSGAKLINSIVKTVEFNDTSKTFKVFTDEDSEQYDHVVIAAPLTKDMRLPINFVNFPEDLNVPVPGRYHRTVCTFVSGEINGEYFGYKYSNDVPGSIFVLNENLFFNSISLLKPSTKLSPNIYKVFSEDILTEKQLKSLFKTVKSTEVIDWLAYPQYSTELRNDSFVLYENLYYVNAVEWAASAMEMSAIGGKNVALMVYNVITGGNPKYTFDSVSSNAKSGINVEL